MSLSLWGNKRPHHWLRAMLLKNGSVLKISSERFCFALFLKMWGQLDTEGTSPYCSGGQKEESSLMLTDPQPASPRRNQRWCYAALIYGGTAKWLLISFSHRDPHTTLTLLSGKLFPVNMLPLCHWGKFWCCQSKKWHNITMSSSVLQVIYLNKGVYKGSSRETFNWLV